MVKEGMDGASQIIEAAAKGGITGLTLVFTIFGLAGLFVFCFYLWIKNRKKSTQDHEIHHNIIDTTLDVNASVSNIESIFTNNYLSISSTEFGAVKASVSSIQLRKRNICNEKDFYKNEVLGRVIEADIREILIRILPNSIEITNKSNNEIEKLAHTLVSDLLRKTDFYAAAGLIENSNVLDNVIKSSEQDIYNELLSLKASIENRMGIMRRNLAIHVGG